MFKMLLRRIEPARRRVVVGAEVQAGHPPPARRDQPWNDKLTLLIEDKFCSLIWKSNPRRAGAEAEPVFQGLQEIAQPRDLLGRGHLGEGELKTRRDRTKGGQEHVERADSA